jgi:DNA-binding HxlR family transcriptional regulator
VTRRSYDQFCGLARALDVVGERWTLLIVRNLLLGPRRYSDLLAELPGLTTNLLAKRLAELEDAGLIERVERPPPFAATVYALTASGAALEPAVHALAAWGGRFLDRPRRTDTVNPGWGLFSLKRRYKGGLVGSLAVVVDGRRYVLRFSQDALSVKDVDDGPVDATVETDAATLRAAFLAGDRGARAKLSKRGDVALVGRALDALAPG